jgi:hypothetical protein
MEDTLLRLKDEESWAYKSHDISCMQKDKEMLVMGEKPKRGFHSILQRGCG